MAKREAKDLFGFNLDQNQNPSSTNSQSVTTQSNTVSQGVTNTASQGASNAASQGATQAAAVATNVSSLTKPFAWAPAGFLG